MREMLMLMLHVEVEEDKHWAKSPKNSRDSGSKADMEHNCTEAKLYVCFSSHQVK